MKINVTSKKAHVLWAVVFALLYPLASSIGLASINIPKHGSYSCYYTDGAIHELFGLYELLLISVLPALVGLGWSLKKVKLPGLKIIVLLFLYCPLLVWGLSSLNTYLKTAYIKAGCSEPLNYDRPWSYQESAKAK